MSGKTGQRARTVIFMAVATIVCVSAVSAVHLGTRETIRRNDALFLQRAVLEASGAGAPEDPLLAARAFGERVEEVKGPDGEVLYYAVREAGSTRVTAYVFPGRGPGLWGRISAVVGLRPDLATLTGIGFTEQNETPGLGGRIAEEWFRGQFRGKRGPFNMKGKAAGGETEFDAVTGATVTSKAVRDILNETLRGAPGIVARAGAGGK